MKNTRRALSLLLVLMMVLSLNLTAFAATNAATLKITVEGEDYITSTIDSGISVMDALLSQEDFEAYFSDPFSDINGNPACALISLMGFGSAPADGPSSGETVTAWSSTNDGYGLVSTDVDANGKITYTYIYIGYDWVYSVKNAAGESVDVSALYMNQYTINDGDTVTVDYAYQRVVWTSEKPILPSYPYI